MLRSLLTTTDSMETDRGDAGDVGCNEEVDQASSSGNDDAGGLLSVSMNEADESEINQEIVEEEVVSPEAEIDLANAADVDGDAASDPEAANISASTGTTSVCGTGGKKDKSKNIGPVYHTPGSNMKLIKLVRKEPCLWDPRHVQYRDSAKKDKCWEHIARQVNMQIGHARQRWKSLRDTFTRKVRKIAIIEAAGGYSGSGEDPCQWKYFQQLKFLEHVIHTHRPRLQPANGSNGTTQPTKNPLALPNLTLSINPLDCDDEEEEDIGPQRAWPLQDERELIHYMRDWPLLWSKADLNFNNDASRDMAIIQIHTNFQERYTWSEIQNKINGLVKKFQEGDNSWIHQESLQYIANTINGATAAAKSAAANNSNGTNCNTNVKHELMDSDDCSQDCSSLLPQVEMDEGDEVKSVTVSTTTNASGCPTVKVISTSLSSTVETGPKTTCANETSAASIVQAAQANHAATLSLQGLPAAFQNGTGCGDSNQSAPIRIITVSPNGTTQNAAIALGGATGNGSTILIPSGGQGLLQMLQAAKAAAGQDVVATPKERRAASIEKRIDTFTTWIKAYLAMVEPDDLDRIELEIHELMVKHTKRTKGHQMKPKSRSHKAKKAQAAAAAAAAVASQVVPTEANGVVLTNGLLKELKHATALKLVEQSQHIASADVIES